MCAVAGSVLCPVTVVPGVCVCSMQARLESQLSDLYHKLEQLQPNLCSLGLASSCSRGECTLGTPHAGKAVASPYSPQLQHSATVAALPATSIRCDTLLSSTLPLLRGCCSSLLSLSLLVPAAPWVGGARVLVLVWEGRGLSRPHINTCSLHIS